MKKSWIYHDLVGNKATFVYTNELTQDEKDMFNALDNGEAVALAIIGKEDSNHGRLRDSISYYAKVRCSFFCTFDNEVLTLIYAYHSWIRDAKRLKENIEMTFRVIG